MRCGRPVGPPEDAARVRVSAAAPPALTEQLLGAATSAERKVVTILFADLVGSTALAERLDPEDWKAILNPALDRFAQAIYRYEGTIAQMLGDGMLAFFGAPPSRTRTIRFARSAPGSTWSRPRGPTRTNYDRMASSSPSVSV